ncbi:Error-prone, lesion bypass DNA polymerase V (UmuC) [uncultured Candidatus Thioglobus sp.]|nr:Error-prone, lesion bypass DNA polymerase V (UmuC) [uncultured Candidatus Thioglobus sp.]
MTVLSNNDDCIVARSQEVKELGIKMATPVHSDTFIVVNRSGRYTADWLELASVRKFIISYKTYHYD